MLRSATTAGGSSVLETDPVVRLYLSGVDLGTQQRVKRTLGRVARRFQAHTFANLRSSLSRIPKQDLYVILPIVSVKKDDRTSRALTDLIIERSEAGDGIIRGLLDFRDVRTVRRLGQIVSDRKQSVESRYWAAAALAGLSSPLAIDSLCSVLEDRISPATVRAQAAEALGCVGTRLDLRSRETRRIEAVLTSGLDDPDVEVRFWCTYALSQAGSKRSLTTLKRYVKDSANCPGWWTVGKEVRAAMRAITRR